jgi:hypothetical protein
MAMVDWIERSLERLEWLEAERERLAALDPSPAAMMAECDTEIATLYEVLEGAAGEGEDTSAAANEWDEPAEAPVADAGVPVAYVDGDHTLTFIEHVGWTTFRDLEPLASVSPPVVASAPVDDGLDFVVDEQWNGGSIGWRWILPAAAALLIFVGLGTWLGLQPGEAVASTPSEASATPERVEAAAIPDDTQEPIAARGIDADRTPSMELDAALDADRPGAAARPPRTHRPRRERGASPSSHAIDLGKSREPLAGL